MNTSHKLSCTVGALGLLFVATASVAGQAAPGAAAGANNEFSVDLYGQISKGAGNIIVSPLSVGSAVAMAEAGAAGQTQKEMSAILHRIAAADADGGFMSSLAARQSKEFELAVANAMWGEKRVQFKPQFVSLLESRYKASATALDFMANPEAARQTINKWVAEHTAGRISELLMPGTVSSSTALILTNAVYFKGAWVSPFKKDATRDAPFTLGDGSTIQTPMMGQTHEFGYLRGNGYAALELPYAGETLVMDLFLPDRADGLPDFEKTLSNELLQRDLAALKEQRVQVAMPRFTMRWGRDLSGNLAALGMKQAFTSQADFSAMTDKPLKITQVVHEAFIDVNEQGTEAGAATAVRMAPTAIAPSPPEFRADHPFFFLIRDLKSGAIVFMGRLMRP